MAGENLPSLIAGSRIAEQSGAGIELPVLIANAGNAARFAYEEFLLGRMRNKHTRRAYERAARRFFAWCEGRRELTAITPADVGRYLDELELADTSKKLHLSALRHLFDEFVVRHVVVLNPATSVRGPRISVVEGLTPEITVQQARALLASLKTTTALELRDRAVIGTLIYTAARVGAIAKLRRKDFYHDGEQHNVRFREKGGKSREIPVRHDLAGYFQKYVETLSEADEASPLFLTGEGKTGRLTANGASEDDLARMVKRRMRQAGLPKRLSAHSFRVATITDLLDQGVPLEDVQHLAGHADPRTTRLYDRRKRRIKRNIVERISI